MPFKTSEELKKFLSSEPFICKRCQNISKTVLEHSDHEQMHKDQDELEKLRKMERDLEAANAKPNPDLKRMLENKVNI